MKLSRTLALKDLNIALSQKERRFIVLALNTFRSAGHALPTEENVNQFTTQYVLNCLGKVREAFCEDKRTQTAKTLTTKIKRRIKISRPFTATLTFAQYSRGQVVIVARSLREARRKAAKIGADEVDDWKPVDVEVSVGRVVERTKDALKSA